MDLLNKVVENLKIPHLFRDILFALGGLVIIFEIFSLHNLSKIMDGSLINLIGSVDFNFISTVLVFSISYLAGRGGMVIMDLFYEAIRLVYTLLGILKAPRSFKKILLGGLKSFVDGGRKYIFRKITKDTPTTMQIFSYIGLNRPLADLMERHYYANIFYAHLFVVFGVAFYFYRSYYFILIMTVLLWKKYCNENSMDNTYKAVYDILVYQNTEPSEGNRLLSELASQKS